MATFAALSFQFRHVYYVVMVCVLLRALQIALPSQLQRYSANHEAWKQLHILNFTTNYYLNDSVIANASYTGTWDITHLLDEAREAKEAENPTTETPIFSLWNAKRLLVSALTYVVSYYWNLFLERKLPARPRGNTPKETTEGVSEDAEEKVVKRWIAAGKVTRASLSGWNTFYKWVLDISVGRALIQLTSEIAWIAIRRKDVLKRMKAAPLVSILARTEHTNVCSLTFLSRKFFSARLATCQRLSRFRRFSA